MPHRLAERALAPGDGRRYRAPYGDLFCQLKTVLFFLVVAVGGGSSCGHCFVAVGAVVKAKSDDYVFFREHGTRNTKSPRVWQTLETHNVVARTVVACQGFVANRTVGPGT